MLSMLHLITYSAACLEQRQLCSQNKTVIVFCFLSRLKNPPLPGNAA